MSNDGIFIVVLFGCVVVELVHGRLNLFKRELRVRGGDVVDDYFGGGIDGFLGGGGGGFFLLVAGPVACVFVFIVRYSCSYTVKNTRFFASHVSRVSRVSRVSHLLFFFFFPVFFSSSPAAASPATLTGLTSSSESEKGSILFVRLSTVDCTVDCI